MDDLYRIAREVTDDVMGPGTYADVNRGNPHPRAREEVTQSLHEANRRMKERYMIPVNDRSEIPEFQSESEAADWWDSHEITDELWDKLPQADRSVLPIPRSRREYQ